jgi:hypothetical protein
MEAVDEVWVFEQAEKLSDEDRGRLINRLLSGSGLLVICKNRLKNHLIKRIDAMGPQELGETLHAIAERIAS